MVSLSKVFAIDLLAYAVMSNHYHVVVKVDLAAARAWTEDEVKVRWSRIFSVPDVVTDELLVKWRSRLSDLSWYMRCLNEPLARTANREDDCKGRFWESRFRCQALLDDAALLRCMAYVDLNPIRANVAATPEASKYTSISARLSGREEHLAPFVDRGNVITERRGVPMRRMEYLALVDWTGRQLRRGKVGRIGAHQPLLLARLGVDSDDWIAEMTHYGRWYYRAVGTLQSLQSYCEYLGQRWVKGVAVAARIAT